MRLVDFWWFADDDGELELNFGTEPHILAGFSAELGIKVKAPFARRIGEGEAESIEALIPAGEEIDPWLFTDEGLEAVAGAARHIPEVSG